MPATTPHRGYPYPVGSDADDLPKIMQNALTPVDTDMDTVKTDLAAQTSALAAALSGKRLRTGTASIVGGPSDSYTRTVSFGATFSAPPLVWVSIPTSAGGTTQVDIRPFNITTTAFIAWIHSYDHSNLTYGGAKLSVPIHWLAIGS